MAEKAAQKKASKEEKGRSSKTQVVLLLVFAAIVVIAVFFGSYSLLSSGSGSSANYTVFWNNFAAAPRAGIVIDYYNSSVFSSGLSCATSLIQNIIESQSLHRNSSTLDFYVINSTACTYSLGLGGTSSNSLTGTPSQCESLSAAEPRIVIGYALRNITKFNSTVLSIEGNADYLQMCGVSSTLASS